MKVQVTNHNGDKNIVEVDCTREEIEVINNGGCPDTRDVMTGCKLCVLSDVICFSNQPKLEEVEVVPARLVAPMAGEVTVEPKKAHKVWAQSRMDVGKIEEFSREHEILGIIPYGNALGEVRVFYVKEEV